MRTWRYVKGMYVFFPLKPVFSPVIGEYSRRSHTERKIVGSGSDVFIWHFTNEESVRGLP